LIPGEGDHLVPILDPLFVNEITVKKAEFTGEAQHVLIRGLKRLDLESVR
jgi:hypothetical protein